MCLALGFFLSLPTLAQVEQAEPMREGFYVYEVERGQTLWGFAKSFGLADNEVPEFIRDLLNENPQIRNANRVEKSDKLFISEHLYLQMAKTDPRVRLFVPKATIGSAHRARAPGNAKQISIELTGVQQKRARLEVAPIFSFSRVDAEDTSSGGEISLLSDLVYGFQILQINQQTSTQYDYFELEVEWQKFQSSVGDNIDNNSFSLIDLSYGKAWELSRRSRVSYVVGIRQNPYVFTDSNGDLIFRKSSQPAVGLEGSLKLSDNLSLDGGVEYLLDDFAGTAELREGYSFEGSVTKVIPWGRIQTVPELYFNYITLRSSVSSQAIQNTGIRLNLAF